MEDITDDERFSEPDYSGYTEEKMREELGRVRRPSEELDSALTFVRLRDEVFHRYTGVNRYRKEGQ